MGNPDPPAPPHVIEKLKETLGKPRTDRYSSSRGIAGLRRAQAAYYERRFGVKLNPGDADSRHARLQGRFRQRRASDHRAGRCDSCAQSELSDPCLRLSHGGRCDPLRAVRANSDFSDARARHRAFHPKADCGCRLLSGQSDRLCRRSRLLQGPHCFAKKHEILVLSDLAYAEVYFDTPPPSVLQVNGAMDIAVEFTSMSKTFSSPAGAWGLPSAMSASSRLWRG